MDFKDRIEKLTMLVAAAGRIVDGSKKLQKLAFICESAGDSLGQNFKFHHYGVYSPTLAADVDAAARLGAVQLYDGLGTVIAKLPEGCAPTVPSTRGFQLVTKLKGEEARSLEVLTTIIYLHNNGYSGDQLTAKLHALKGQHSNFFEGAGKLAKQHFSIDVPVGCSASI